jgi:hypothetical protein
MNTPYPDPARSDDPVAAPGSPIPPQASASSGPAGDGMPGDPPDSADDDYEPV